jgi:acyl-CoA thioesterase
LDKAYKRKPVSVQRFSTTGFDPLSPVEIYMKPEEAEEVKTLYKKKLLERYEKSKRTYPRFERPVSVRPQNLINPFGF